MAGEKHPHRLPIRQLTILAICRFAEPITLTSLFPYLPEMIASFQIASDDVGFWVGVTSATYSVFQCLSAIPWGRMSDRFGRKPIVMLCLLNTMLTTLLWGFSTSLPMALVARALNGAGNGNVGIIRTMVAEMCPWKDLQPRAFSIMPLVYNVGSVIGPSIGGLLANPYNLKPGEHRSDALFDRFPYAAPNLVGAAFFAVGLTTGILYLEETLSTKKDRRDYGLLVGKKINATVKGAWRRARRAVIRSRGAEEGETEPLLKPASGLSNSTLVDEENARKDDDKPSPPPPGFSEVLNKQSVLNLVTYTVLAMHSIGFDALIPVFLYYDRLPLDTPETHLPFKFKSGFGATKVQTGIMFTLYGVMNIIFQLALFPPTAKRFGVLRCMRVVSVVYPVVYILIPFTKLIPGLWGMAALFVLWTCKGLAGSFAFPCSTILLTNSASSLRILGTLNGIATSVSAIGRACGPIISGGSFTFGAKHLGYVIFPFWVLAAVGAVGAAPVYFLVEGEGFAGDDSDDESDDAQGDGEGADQLDGVGPEGHGPRPIGADGTALADDPIVRSESAYGSLGDLSRTPSRTFTRTWSAASSVVASSEDGDPTASGEAERQEDEEPRNRLQRQSSVPIGGGPGSRRLSSNLGHSMSGYGLGQSMG